jgi:ubiquinone biosynthesis protein UbiJ
MKLPGTLLAGIEAALNRIIADQPGIVSDALHNQCVCLQLDGIGLPLYFRFNQDTVYLLDDCPGGANATINGTPISLAAAAFSGTAHTRDLGIEGNLQVAQAFERLLNTIDIDWEEIISRYTGDAFAFQVGELARGFKTWGQQSANAFADDLRDYLQIETRQLPIPDEVDRFNNAVDEIRAGVERLEMRVQRLQTRLAARQESAS